MSEDGKPVRRKSTRGRRTHPIFENIELKNKLKKHLLILVQVKAKEFLDKEEARHYCYATAMQTLDDYEMEFITEDIFERWCLDAFGMNFQQLARFGRYSIVIYIQNAFIKQIERGNWKAINHALRNYMDHTDSSVSRPEDKDTIETETIPRIRVMYNNPKLNK